MDVVLQKIYEFQEFYDWAFTVADDRVTDWPLMWGFSPTLVFTALYLLAVYIGPRIMENRAPIKLKYTLIVYNFICVLINLHIFTELFICSRKLGYGFRCQLPSYTYDQYDMRIAEALWWYYISKCVEFLDTIFFVIRKKNNQISFLHVFHHASMFPLCYIMVKWYAGGLSYFPSLINSFVHVVMYTYFGLAAFGPEMQKFLWWKRNITQLQLLQFLVDMTVVIYAIYIDCPFPKWTLWTGVFFDITMIILFSKFYVQTYVITAKTTFTVGKVTNEKTTTFRKNPLHRPSQRYLKQE